MRLTEFFNPEPVVLLEMRPDSDRFEQLDRADQWLAKYTYENLDKWPPHDVLAILLNRYPIKETMTLYRGMNFRTKEKYDEFMATVADGVLKTNGISSWGSSPDEVESFAVTRPSYYLDRDTMVDHGEAQQQREYVSGYRGIILSVKAKPGQAIDVNASKLGHEREYILTPGEYNVTVSRDLKKYREALDDGDTDIDTVIAKYDPEGRASYDNQFYEFVIHHHAKELSDKSKKKLLSIVYHAPEIGTHDTHSVFNDASTYPMEIYYPSQYMKMAAEGYFTPKDTDKARQEAKTLVGLIVAKYKEFPDKIIKCLGFTSLAEFAGMGGVAKKTLQQHIGRQYAAMQEEGRAINNMDPELRNSAIYNIGKRAQAILGQMN